MQGLRVCLLYYYYHEATQFSSSPDGNDSVNNLALNLTIAVLILTFTFSGNGVFDHTFFGSSSKFSVSFIVLILRTDLTSSSINWDLCGVLLAFITLKLS